MLNLKHDYFIDSDGNCLKLCKRAVRHDDEANTDREVVTLIGYHTDLSTALNSSQELSRATHGMLSTSISVITILRWTLSWIC